MGIELEKYENNPVTLRYSEHLFKDALPIIWEDYQNGLLKDTDLIEINGVLGVLLKKTYISDVLELHTHTDSYRIGVIKQRHSKDVRELCVNCIYLKNQMCEELKKMIYPDYEINDNTDFYLNGFDIHNPEKFGCKLFCCKN